MKTYFVYLAHRKQYQVNNGIKIYNENINHIGKNNKEESVKFLGIHINKHLTWKNISI